MDRTELVELIEKVLKNARGSSDTAGRIADCVMQKYILIHQVDNESDPPSKDFLAAWHAHDRMYADLANIKTIPPAPSDIKFKIPDIRPAQWIPKGTMYAIPPRRDNETDEEWGSRCVKITGIGDSE